MEDLMKAHRIVLTGLAVAMMVASWSHGTAAQSSKVGTKHVKHVLLLSIDGMHAVDLYNCTHGIAGANVGDPYSPNLPTLTRQGSIMWRLCRRNLRIRFLDWARSLLVARRSPPAFTTMLLTTARSMGRHSRREL